MPNLLSLPERAYSFSWSYNPLDRHRFLLLSWLLHIRDKQQEPVTPTETKTETSSYDSDDELECDDETSQPQPLSHQARLFDLKKRFLNRLAEVMAPVKEGKGMCAKQGSGNASTPPRLQPDASGGPTHVAATVLVEDARRATIYVGKNRGLSEDDGRVTVILEKWIQTMAINGKRPAISTDPVWRELLRFYMPRLCLYMEAFRDLFEGHTCESNSNDPGFMHNLETLYTLCSGLNHESQVDDQTKISKAVSLAYELRSDPKFENFVCEKLAVRSPRRMWMSICYLGRLRAAYETFKEAAMHFSSFKQLRLEPVKAPPPEKTRFDLKFITMTMNDLGLANRGFRVKAQKLKALCELESCTHAEIQLLLEIKKQETPPRDRVVFPYIGTSKKTCFLCAQVLAQVGDFATRGSHGKIYPRWTIPEGVPLDARFVLQFASGLLSIQKSIKERLKDERKSIQHVAESSVGMSALSSGSDSRKRLRHHAKTRQRIENARIDLPTSHNPPCLLKDPIFEVVAVRIPANGQAPCMTKLGICETQKQYPSRDSFMGIVPQFQDYWAQCQFERGTMTFEAKQQPQDALNGMYRIYWNLDPELGENRYLRGITVGPSSPIPPGRRFFYGDVFIIGMRTDERGYDFGNKGWALYRDLHSSFLDSHLLGTQIRYMWESRELEKQVKTDQHLDQSAEDDERCRALFLAEMSKEEREIVQGQPFLLDYILTREGRTSSGYIPTGISYPEDEPEMVRLHGLYKKSVLEHMEWKGFSSEVL